MRGAERVLDPLGIVGPSEEEAEVSVALRQGDHVPPRPDGEFAETTPYVTGEEGLASPSGFASTKVIVKGGRPSANHTLCARSRNILSAAALAALTFVASSVT